jgi:hypothetical protein
MGARRGTPRAVWDWGGRGAGWGAERDGRGGEAEWVRADGASRPRRADDTVDVAAAGGWHGESGRNGREWRNVLDDAWQAGKLGRSAANKGPADGRSDVNIIVFSWMLDSKVVVEHH